MAILADLPELVGFFSYSREDDEDSKGALSALRERIQRELRGQLGRSTKTFRLWQDKEAIASGKLWEEEIKIAVGQAVFFIPIITPTVVRSPYCRLELDAFLAREAELGRGDLVFPILYIKVPELEDIARQKNDPVLSIIAKRQYLDWRELRHRDIHSTNVMEVVERFCAQICDALRQSWVSPEERKQQEEAEAKRRAEEETRQRVAEEERRRREAETAQRRKEEAEAKRREEDERKRAEVQRRAEEERKRAESEAKLAAEARLTADKEEKEKREPSSAPSSPPPSATAEPRGQPEHVSREQPKRAAISSTMPWSIIAGSAIILGVIAIAAVWRLGTPVTPQAPPSVMPQAGPSVTPQDLSADAMNQLGLLYVVRQDYAKACELFEKAADKGDVLAMFRFGNCYENGWGAAQDNAKAREWYQKAADKGSTDGMYQLGTLYAKGYGVPQDYAKAREWYQKAADKGSTDGMNQLGTLYAKGYGVPQDYAKAREWYQKAADKGSTDAKEFLKKLPIR